MIYISKKGLPGSVKGQIISLRKSDRWKRIPGNDTKAIRSIFDNEFPKAEVKDF